MNAFIQQGYVKFIKVTVSTYIVFTHQKMLIKNRFQISSTTVSNTDNKPAYLHNN